MAEASRPEQTRDESDIAEIRQSVSQLCAKYSEDYWLDMDRTNGYPSDFVAELTQAGFLGVLIPEEYGGAGLGLAEASVIMEEINRSGGNSGACHGQMYNMTTLVRHGSEDQRRRYLPAIAAGERKAEVCRYAFYAGLSGGEIATLLGLPKSTVTADIRFVRAWLSAKLDPRPSET